MTTVQDFLSSNEITGALTPEQAAQLLELPHQGDTVTPTETADAPAPAPAAAAETNTTTEPPAEDLSADNAVILAKDGKHTIPFDKLTEARESAQQAASERDAALARAAELQAQLDAAQRQPAATTTQTAAAVDLKALRLEQFEAVQSGDADKAMELGEQIDAENQRIAEERVMQRLSAQRTQEQAQAAEAAMQQTAATLKAQYPALDQSSPAYSPGAEAFVVAERDLLISQGEKWDDALRQAATKAAPLFGWSNGNQAAVQPTTRAAQAAAAAAIAAAKAPTPATLSDIPGGKPAGASLEAQMASKNGPEMLDVMLTMSREQRDEFLNRTL